ncbi:MAG: hypothetical protein NT113_03920 [Hyphomicrobiales bacterium]|nr:hypothetical protein [Hyphomicrobiales bacterium]
MSLLARIFMLLAAPITALFVSRDALNFDIIQMIVAMTMLTAVVAALLFWPRRKSDKTGA